ncbi:ABC transporter substrate-binding protein [Achromobacter aloeverae]|uniref:Taurine ABC transporter substrate-binding protein n=1 Tax=Achromobacter aloeverae TaxID=1750518 RepID=A0A4Q1HF58_9BURK|nr:ABC transporter substrate-binding protein [Achromobacter aloeverae]RXN85315.1 taurine ABC transporter substrate-binding protein [Achromobacter aloeverae]
MDRRTFLAATSAAVFSGTWGARALAQAAVDPKTRLVLADQGELVRVLLEASGERKTLDFDLQLPNFAGGPAIFEAMRAGALDIAYVGDTPPIQARAAGTLLPIVATISRQLSTYRLVSRPGLVIDTLAQLKGKRISYIEGSGRQVFLIEALSRAGLTLKDIEPVALRIADLPDAIRSSAIDVAVLNEPYVTRLAKQVGATPVRDPVERQLLPGVSYIYARPEVLADPRRSAAIRAFVGALVRAGKWSNAHQEQWGKAYYTDFQRLDPQSTAAILASQSPLVFQTSREAVADHQKLIDILYAAGSIKQRLDATQSFTDAYDAVIAAQR